MNEESKNTIVILLGSNIGARQDWMQQATTYISDEIGQITASSSYYETKAWGNKDQPDFLNQVLVCKTKHIPIEVLRLCLSIEKKLGRNRKEKWGSRTIDIDILYYESEIYATTDLKIPHPYLHERRFTLVPLVEVLPDFVHPIFNFTNKKLLEKCEDTLEVTQLNSK
jgi:2-amino-4-hydroxy-6-hydroxymethyldihydropteridine diphosphokinase